VNDLQRTNDWFAARLGKVTASRVADVIAKTKTGYSASRANYMAEMIVERLTGAPQISTKALQCSGGSIPSHWLGQPTKPRQGTSWM